MLGVFICCFIKKIKAKFVFASRPLPFPPKPIRMKMLIFQPPNILTPLENGRRSLKKQRGFKISLCVCNKNTFPNSFLTFLVCYLRFCHLYRAELHHPRRAQAFSMQRRIALFLKVGVCGFYILSVYNTVSTK